MFRDVAQRGKTSTGWFFGFKPHPIVNDRRELLAVKSTVGNADERKPVPDTVEGVRKQSVCDKGYISQPLFIQLWEQGLQLITRFKKNIKNKPMPLWGRTLPLKRAIIELVHNIPKK